MLQSDVTWGLFICGGVDPICSLGQLVLLCTCGFHLSKVIFFLDQIKFFQGLGGASLDEEGFPIEGICHWVAKLIGPSINALSNALFHLSYSLDEGGYIFYI